MSEDRLLQASERWVGVLLHLYPRPFRDDMGTEVREAYRDHCRAALRRGGGPALLYAWIRALVDSLRNGVGERFHPSGGSAGSRGIPARTRGRGDRGALATGLTISAALHAALFLWSPTFVSVPFEVSEIRLEARGATVTSPRFVYVSLSAPRVVPPDRSAVELHRTPPRVAKVDLARLSISPPCGWPDTPPLPVSGIVRLRDGPSGRQRRVEVHRGTGDRCGDVLISAIVLAMTGDVALGASGGLEEPVDVLRAVTVTADRY